MRAIWLAITAILATGVVATVRADETSTLDHTTYRRYCGACHGPDGKGDGLAGTFMQPKPSDLTQIAKRNGGEFPYMKVMKIIDGRETVRAHGDPEMPVWGEVFHSQAGATITQEAEVRGKLMMITDYVRSIQAK